MSDAKKPREWKVNGNLLARSNGEKFVHVIEYSAYAALQAEVLRLGKEVEELMQVDYWQDRYKIEKARADEFAEDAAKYRDLCK